MSIIVDQTIGPPSPPRSRKTTYNAGVYEDFRGGGGFIAWAEYESPTEHFGITRRRRTERAALKALRHAAWTRWRVLSPTSRAGRRGWNLIEAIEKEMNRK